MHELPITQNILEIALRHAGDATRITRINLVIGDLSSVIGESVQFYWDMLSEGTVAEGADLHFDRIKARFHCSDCEAEFEPDGRKFDCPDCDGVRVELIAGSEFRIESIEVE